MEIASLVYLVGIIALRFIFSPNGSAFPEKLIPWTLLIANYGHLFVIGILLFLIKSGNTGSITWITLATALCISFLGGGQMSMSAEPLTYDLITCLLTAIVWMAINGRLAWLACPPLLFLGDISYPLYLVLSKDRRNYNESLARCRIAFNRWIHCRRGNSDSGSLVDSSLD